MKDITFWNCIVLGILALSLFPWPYNLLGLIWLLGAYGKIILAKKH